VEWLWVIALLGILFGPLLFVFVRGRRGGAPSREDALGSSGVTGVIRNIETGGRSPGGPLPPP
jgi:hypothetical protein